MSEINYQEIDEGIREIIKLFNWEGFETIYSCSGHKENDEYIIEGDKTFIKVNQPYIGFVYDNSTKDIVEELTENYWNYEPKKNVFFKRKETTVTIEGINRHELIINRFDSQNRLFIYFRNDFVIDTVEKDLIEVSMELIRKKSISFLKRLIENLETPAKKIRNIETEKKQNWILKNCMNKKDKIDLSGLSFPEMEIDISNISGKKLQVAFAEMDEEIINKSQKSKVINNDFQETTGYISNEFQVSDFIDNRLQEAKEKIYNSQQSSKRQINNSLQLAPEINNQSQSYNKCKS